MTQHVVVLMTIPKPDRFAVGTSCLSTLRVGFPDARITVYDNVNPEDMAWAIGAKIKEKCPDVELVKLPKRLHHAQWIKQMIEENTKNLFIVDPDTFFWERCDWFEFTRLAGHHIPMIWNEFSNCISMPRLHTAMLYIPDCLQLILDIMQSYPECHEEAGEYCPCDPFMPAVRFIEGVPYFWDTCSGLYHMVGGQHFQPKHLNCYSHVNSSSFYDLMMKRVENKKAFAHMHKMAEEDHEWFRGFWRSEDQYYKEMNMRAQKFLVNARNCGGG